MTQRFGPIQVGSDPSEGSPTAPLAQVAGLRLGFVCQCSYHTSTTGSAVPWLRALCWATCEPCDMRTVQPKFASFYFSSHPSTSTQLVSLAQSEISRTASSLGSSWSSYDSECESFQCSPTWIPPSPRVCGSTIRLFRESQNSKGLPSCVPSSSCSALGFRQQASMNHCVSSAT